MDTKQLKRGILLLFLFLFSGTFYLQPLCSANRVKSLSDSLQIEGYCNIAQYDSTIKIDLRYATPHNFTHKVLYQTLDKAFLHRVALHKLIAANRLLHAVHPHYSLIVYDAARPLSVQRRMYDVVRNTKYAPYVANPAHTGLHNYGMAVDLSICDQNGKPLDMGTSFDYFGTLAGIRHEKAWVAQHLLTQTQYENRLLLRKIMVQAGFYPILGEWWHFNAVPFTVAKKKYRLIK